MSGCPIVPVAAAVAVTAYFMDGSQRTSSDKAFGSFGYYKRSGPCTKVWGPVDDGHYTCAEDRSVLEKVVGKGSETGSGTSSAAAPTGP
jgi:hypothetical protein